MTLRAAAALLYGYGAAGNQYIWAVLTIHLLLQKRDSAWRTDILTQLDYLVRFSCWARDQRRPGT